MRKAQRAECPATVVRSLLNYCVEYGEQNAGHTIKDYSQSGFAGDCGWYQIRERRQTQLTVAAHSEVTS